MIQQLVVNGCSYTHSYALGNGHEDLAQRLGIAHADSIAISGSANSRILRTTLKHSYTAPSTLYVLGMTFLSRLEVPICEPETDFEGRWVNPQNQEFAYRWQTGWNRKESEQFVDTKLKTEVYSILDRTEDLMYRMLSTIDSLKSRGHRVLMFQQADDLYQGYLTDLRLRLFDCPEIVNGYQWRATAWQSAQGVEPKKYPPGSPYVPPDMTHPAVGHHHKLNEFLTTYIQEYKILQ
jgi:hypothetical protein